jgi:hypothetical protein
MKTRKTTAAYIRKIAEDVVGAGTDAVGGRSSVSSAPQVVSSGENSIGEKAILSSVMQYVAEMIPHHFRGSGGHLKQQTPPGMTIIATAFDVDSGIVAGGRLHSFSGNITLDFSSYLGQEGKFYVMLNGAVPYISRIRDTRHGCLGAVILKAESQRIIDDDPIAREYTLDPLVDISPADGYIISGRDPLFDDFAVCLDDPYFAALKNMVNEIQAENLVGVLRLHEGLTISNTAGTMLADSSKIQFLNSSGAVLAEYGAERAFVGDIEILPTALQSRNYVYGVSGFSINRNGVAEFEQIVARGILYAQTGWIGGATGWIINNGGIFGDGGYIGICTTAGNATYALWVSSDTPANASFSVTHAGVLTAVGANISGTIQGGEIHIGGYDTSSFHVDTDGNMWLGAGTLAASTFSVTKEGVVNAKEVNGVRPFVEHYADEYALELELMKMNFQYVSWAQFAVYDSFDDSTKRASPDPSTNDARVYESKLDNGEDDTADKVFGFVSKTYSDITTLFSGSSSSVGAGFLEDTDQGWFTNECIGLTLVDSGANEFTVISNTSDTLTVSGTPAAGDYTLRDDDPGYAIAFLSFLDASNGGYGYIKYEVSFDGGSHYQTFYDSNAAVDYLESTQAVDNTGRDYIVRLSLKNDGDGLGPIVYKFLVCTDPSPWRF